MKINYIRLDNYIGIYNGLKLNTIEIDFTKGKHNLVIIRGDNGSGKSTIFKALTPLPDSNDNFIPGLKASKYISIQDNDIVYDIKFIHSIKDNGDRETTKGYIYKNINGNIVDMNPNGNISSYKDIIYSEFKLDSNFIALSQLSTEDRGLATKKPAERKKFVNSIIDKLEVYNNIHKTLTKRSSVFKSMINSITSKLDSLGDINKLNSILVSLENRINNLENNKNKVIEDIASNKSIINVIDASGTIQNKYSMYMTTLDDTKRQLQLIITSIKNLYKKLNIDNTIDTNKLYTDIVSNKTQVQIEIQSLESNIDSMILERENEATILNNKIERLNSLKSESNYDELVKQIQVYRNKKSSCENVFNTIGVEDALKISKDEYIVGLNTLKEIKDIVDSYMSGAEHEVLREAIYLEGENQYPDIELTKKCIEDIRLEIQELEKEYNENMILIKISEKLSQRPDSCKIDECGFIKDAIMAKSKNPEQLLLTISETLNIKRNELQTYTNRLNHENEVIKSINDVKIIIRNIRSHKSILDKLPDGHIYFSEGYLIRRINYDESIDYIDDLYQYIDYANLFDEYSICIDTLNRLENEYKIYESKSSIIDEITKDIDSINTKLDTIRTTIDVNNVKLLNLKELLLELNEKELDCKSLLDSINKYNELDSKRRAIEEDISKVQNDIDKINIAMTNINSLNNTYNSIIEEIKPVMNDRDTIKHSISLYSDYVNELNEYKAMYDKIETIKYYSSPTTGIGLVFMELYMGKVLSIANELLSLLFDSRFTLMPFIITESEFRIPCSNDGLMNDDISSMSSSQVCMISMILSYSLLFNSSTKYNILKADEIDAPLDSTNRTQFALLLEEMMNMLETEQAILISHNSELDTHNADIILLKSNNTEEVDGNIIYRY